MRKVMKSKRFIGDKSWVVFKKNRKETDSAEIKDIWTDWNSLIMMSKKNSKIKERAIIAKIDGSTQPTT